MRGKGIVVAVVPKHERSIVRFKDVRSRSIQHAVLKRRAELPDILDRVDRPQVELMLLLKTAIAFTGIGNVTFVVY